VPFFYYVLHFYLIHAITAIFFFAAGYSWADTNDPASFAFFRPASFGVNLGVVYLVWLAVIGICIFRAVGFAGIKQRIEVVVELCLITGS
jgi:hypothetical protein